MDEPILQIDGLVKHFPVRRGLLSAVSGAVKAVDGISFSVGRGETLGLVGESGCGKSTLGRLILGLLPADDGQITLNGRDITNLSESRMRPVRRDIQIIFQDPYSSLNPKMRIREIIGEPLRNYFQLDGEEIASRVNDLLIRVGLAPHHADKFPHEFSGGQRQRLGIARALALNPGFIVCDEAVSALDVSVQAQVINLLVTLRRDFGISYLFIAHDLSVVRHISDRVAVMYLGKIVEIGTTEQIFETPQHPYTQALLRSVPKPDPARKRAETPIMGDIPSPLDPPPGCRFHTRCPHAMDKCRRIEPPPRRVSAAHFAACHLIESEPIVRHDPPIGAPTAFPLDLEAGERNVEA